MANKQWGALFLMKGGLTTCRQHRHPNQIWICAICSTHGSSPTSSTSDPLTLLETRCTFQLNPCSSITDRGLTARLTTQGVRLKSALLAPFETRITTSGRCKHDRKSTNAAAHCDAASVDMALALFQHRVQIVKFKPMAGWYAKSLGLQAVRHAL